MSDLIQRLNADAASWDPEKTGRALETRTLLRIAAAEIERLERANAELSQVCERISAALHRADEAERQRDEAKAELAARLMALQAANSAVVELQRQRDEAIAALRELMDGQDDGGSEATQRFEAAWESARRLLNQKEGT